MSHRTMTLAWVLLTPLVIAGAGQHRGWADDAYDRANEVYEERVQRPSLYKRTEGRRALAATRDLRAVEILARDYSRAEWPEEEVRETLVALLMTDRWSGTGRESIANLRAQEQEARDAWLWYRSLMLEAGTGDLEQALDAALKVKNPWLQEAALRSLATSDDVEVLRALPGHLASVVGKAETDKRRTKRHKPKPRHSRRERRKQKPVPFDEAGALASLRLESAARMLLALKSHHDEEVWKHAALLLLEYFDSKQAQAHTRLVIARCLATSLGIGMAEMARSDWVLEVRGGGSGAGADDKRYASFAGLKAHGRRIVYVLDFSDSMLTPLVGGERRMPVITGSPSPKGKDALPWHRIHTRFDLARELLKASLETLSDQKLYAVVWFGDEAGTLVSTPNLVPATPENIKQTIIEIDRIRRMPQGTGSTRFKYGSLRGETNLHGGIRLALHLSEHGDLGDDAFVSSRALMEGVESIFLFSDGHPTTDNWKAVDRRDNEGVVTDRETNTPAPLVPELHFPGPFAEAGDPFLLDDLARRTLFRTVQINCVGIGSADMTLLGCIADLGGGKTRQLGRDRE